MELQNKNKTNLYREFKDRQAKEYDEFYTNSKGIFYAFGNEQFKEGMESIGLTENDTDKIYSGGSGIYYKKEVAKELKIFLDKQVEEMDQAKKDDNFLYDMFYYEMGNHEYGYTRDLTDTIEACDFTIEEIENDERILNILEKARKDYIKWDNEVNG